MKKQLMKLNLTIFFILILSGCVPGMKMKADFDKHTISSDPLCDSMFFRKYMDANLWATTSYFTWAKQNFVNGTNFYSCGWATNKTVSEDATDAEIMAVALGNCERYKKQRYGHQAIQFESRCKILFKGYELYDENSNNSDSIDLQ